MTRALWLLIGLGMALSGVIAEELDRPASDGELAAAPAPLPPPAFPAAAPPDDPSAGWAATMRARPLFSPDRRPPASAPADPAVQAKVPRLAGIIVSSLGSRAIFAPEGTRSIIAGEGDVVGGNWKVKQIAADEVTLAGPEGEQVLRLSFANSPAPRSLARDSPVTRAGNAGQPGYGMPAPESNAPVPALLPALLSRLQPPPTEATVIPLPESGRELSHPPD